MLREAEIEYRELLKQLEEDENVTREDIETFKKNAILHQSILEVRKRAQHQAEIRQSPERYRSFHSKIGQNIKVASNKFGSTIQLGSPSFASSTNKFTVSIRENPFDITDQEL
jgi:hypothetical protein